ncbi:hybrid sensor histidine kinase/response regulator transcription factor [Christiangramia flava]|uniref:histidine kinase n=1 Tax=Christiangramia flava JLT2011 TaxID=1229726 RepID=A0A1L7I5Q6_9FLAO|nr:ATP-binding protein [Christiangramia flava]APU68554.1 DNA-binding response regulator, AraC family [Christiangramia flava JLT2011]OSS40659.1 two-component system sensor histidine kinase/response regulator, hybrid ('one component system') [Christiangramia flava JLT2011]
MRAILILLLLKMSFSYAQQAYEIDTSYPVHKLDGQLQVIPDENKEFTPEDILNKHFEKQLKGDELPRMLEIGTLYWGKTRILTKEELTGWTLHLEDKMIGPPAWTKSNGKVDVYFYANGKLLFHRKAGVEYPRKNRDIKNNWVLNRVSLEGLPQHTPIDIVMKVQGNIFGYPAYFNLSARSPEQGFYHEFNQFHSSFNIFMFGVTFIIFLYHFLLFLYLRQKVFFWFSVWLFFCALTQAMSMGLSLDWFPEYRYPIWMLASNGIFYSFWFFGRVFVNSKKKFQQLDRLMLGLALTVLVEVICVILYIILAKPQLYFTGIQFHYIFLLVYTVFSLALSVILALKKDSFARYFGIGTLIANIFLIIGLLWTLSLIVPPFRIDPYVTGIFLQIIIYSFGISYRQQRLSKISQQEKLKNQQIQAEMTRIKDLDELKTRFFTNISHEFRTPLTLIQGPIKQAKLAATGTGENIRIPEEGFKIVERNTQRLQNLIDELLELSKIESGNMKLLLSRGNLISFLKPLVLSFESMAEGHGTTFSATFSEESTTDYFDKSKLEKIVSNLISNALKYTRDEVHVSVKLEKEELTFEVRDNGPGLSEKEQELIFDRFYRVEGSEKKGSGIGLALCKELVELHNGIISVTSRSGQGTTFRVQIPVSLEKLPQQLQLVQPSEKEDPAIPFSTNIPSEEEHLKTPNTNPQTKILVVEDNADLRNFIIGILKPHFTTYSAENGQLGEKMAIELIPDIIISDVMMPEKSGYELCEATKTNIKTSHIPVILLTARADHHSKMQGFTQGADVYLTKPFDPEELLLRIKNLLSSRDQLWSKITSNQNILIDELDLASMDDEFFGQVTQTISKHLDDETFSVEILAEANGFSRSQLFRKMKSLFNKTPNQLISEMRLNKAHELLKNNACTVSEAAYAVGYSNLSYFTKTFKERFGVAPSKVNESSE